MPAEDVAWLDAATIAARVQARRLDPQAVVHAHLQRIARIDAALHAYTFVDHDAVAGDAGPLAGVTVAVKDTQPVAGQPWTWGSRAFADRLAQRDAVPVARSRGAGAAILGKTNLPELAAAVGTTNDLFPATQNPWREGLTPGGSSGGSAAAVAAGLATVALGDDSGGSIRIPAACCGVVGLRPAPGQVPLELPDPTHLNSRGPITRTVADSALMLQVITASAPSPPSRRRRRIGVARTSSMPVDGACWAACERAADALDVAGHRLEPIAWEPEIVAENYRTVRRVSLAAFAGDPDDFGLAVRLLMREGRTISASEFYLAHQRATAAAWRVVSVPLGEFDALLTPTLGRTPMPIAQVPPFLGRGWDDYTQFVLPVSFSGHPAVSVPAGLDGGVPQGVQLVGRSGQVWELLELAAELESLDGFGFARPDGPYTGLMVSV
jgi:amidase